MFTFNNNSCTVIHERGIVVTFITEYCTHHVELYEQQFGLLSAVNIYLSYDYHVCTIQETSLPYIVL